MKKIVLTGGGTAGHVVPHIALLPALEKKYNLVYIGSYQGIEKEMISQKNIPYYAIPTGKLRRYISIENILDGFRVVKGIGAAFRLLRKIKPDLIFSKGGYIAVPVVLAGYLQKIPIVIHESDITPGLTTKISAPLAAEICVTFPETLDAFPGKNVSLTGTPIREEIFLGSKKRGYDLCGFHAGKPVLMIMGGSSGAQIINTHVMNITNLLLKNFQIIHICGRGNLPFTEPKKGYKAFEFVQDDLKDLFAITDLVVSRAGANSIWEWLALRIPNLLIPLPLEASRGDQILNAKSFEKQGFSVVLSQEKMIQGGLYDAIMKTYKAREVFLKAMDLLPENMGNQRVLEVIQKYI